MAWKPPADGQLPEGWTTSSTEREPHRVFGVKVRTWAILLVVVVAAAIFAGIAGSDDDPDVSPGFASVIDALEAEGDCASLQARFDDTDDVDEMEYADAAMRRAGCYD